MRDLKVKTSASGKIIRLFLAVILVIGLNPGISFADETSSQTNAQSEQNNEANEELQAALNSQTSEDAADESSAEFTKYVLENQISSAISFAQTSDDETNAETSTETKPVESTGDCEYVADEILVSFKDGVSKSSAYSAMSALEAVDDSEAVQEIVQSDFTNENEVVTIKLEDGEDVFSAVSEAEEDPRVAYAQPNYVYTLLEDDYTEVCEDDASETELNAGADASAYASGSNTEDASAIKTESSYTSESIPNDPALSRTTASSSANAWHLKAVHAFDAWEIVRTNNTVTVAVLDTGCELNHADLKNQIWQEYAWNSYTDSALTKDYNGHGTHVAGIVAAEANNGIGTAGTSYNAKILPICVFEETGKKCYSSTLVKAYEYLLKYADELNIHVVNMSLGGYVTSLDTSDYAVQNYITEAKEKNIVTVCSGGNGDNGTPKTEKMWPGDYEDCISVTSLSTNGTSASTWCDYNEYKDICAPGESIYSTSSTSTSSYVFKTGTSMASPIVAGAMALLWTADPELSVDEAKELIYNSADELTVTSGREGQYGHGILNIAAALKLLTNKAVGEGSFTVGEYEYSSGYYLVTYTPAEDETGAVYLSGEKMYEQDGKYVFLIPQSKVSSLSISDFIVYSVEECESFNRMDVNCNGRINVVDAQVTYDIAGGSAYTDFSLVPMTGWLAADVTGNAGEPDGVVDAQDAYRILTYVVAEKNS